jgi:AraC family transcriptional regulator, ethanolamine operon transcriptional activator
VPELCRAAGVSQRTLQYAFLDAFSLTPQAFIRRRRLHAARWALLAAHPEQTTVARAAAENGIYQLGRFAGEYARLFGERPSVTLARAPVEPPPSLAIGLPSSRSLACRMPPAGSAMAGTRSQ